MSKTILVTGPDLDPSAARLVADHGYRTVHTPPYASSDVISQYLRETGAVGIVSRMGRLDAGVLDAAPQLRVISKHGAGLVAPPTTTRACPPPAESWSWAALGYEIDRGGDPKRGDLLSAVIVQGPAGRVGLDGEDLKDSWKKPDGSWDRSDAVFWVCAEMDRRGVPPEVAAAVLLDRGMGISDHLYSHVPGDGPSPTFKREGYARRQVERAMGDNDRARSEMLNAFDPPFLWEDAREYLHLRYATIQNMGGKYRVLAYPGVDHPELPEFVDKQPWAARHDGFMTGYAQEADGRGRGTPVQPDGRAVPAKGPGRAEIDREDVDSRVPHVAEHRAPRDVPIAIRPRPEQLRIARRRGAQAAQILLAVEVRVVGVGRGGVDPCLAVLGFVWRRFWNRSLSVM